MEYGVKRFAFSSTDKAVLPINTYGKCKGVSEDYLLSMNVYKKTRFHVFRWGNVTGSRGAAIHSFVKSLREERKVYITSVDMTRFWIRIEDAVKFFLGSYKSRASDEPFYPEMKAAPIISVCSVLAELLGIDEYETEIVGIRPGEKIHECIYTSHEYCVNSENAPRFTRRELKKLLKEFV